MTGVTAEPGYDSVQLYWQNPTDLDFAGTVVRGAEGTTAPASAADGFEVGPGNGTATLVEGLNPGSAYSFSFFARDREGKDAPPATVTVHGTKVTLRVDRSRVIWGDDIVLRGRLTDVLTGDAVLGELQIAAVSPDGEVSLVDHAYTDLVGNFELTTSPGQQYDFVAVFPGDGARMGGLSGPARVVVSSLLLLDPVKKKVKLGKTIQLVVGAGPVDTGKAIVIEKLVKGTWRAVAKQRTDAEGVTVVKLKAKKKGKFKYRAYRPATQGAGSGTSKTVTVTVT